MWIMAAHEMMTLGGTVTGTVDATYDPDDLCDGDTATPVRRNAGSLSLAVTGTSLAVNGLVVANHNLSGTTSVSFSGLGTVVTPAVPPGGIRLNGVELLTTPVTAGSTTVAVTHASPIILGEAIAGIFREIRTLPPRADFPHRPFAIMPEGEFTGLSYTKGAVARDFGGSVYLSTAMKTILQDAFDASRQNSLPTVIIPGCEPLEDALVVTWARYNPKPCYLTTGAGVWHVDVTWQELPRYRWPA